MEAGIDGFALNIGPYDHWTDMQLNLAYEAAEKSSGFTVFISFEYVQFICHHSSSRVSNREPKMIADLLGSAWLAGVGPFLRWLT
jgi:hypothetical protein